MVNERDRDAATGPQPSYEPPRALRVGAKHTGTGGAPAVCEVPGSGAVGDCRAGAGATQWCYENGSSADSCSNQGSGAATVPVCEFNGSDHAR